MMTDYIRERLGLEKKENGAGQVRSPEIIVVYVLVVISLFIVLISNFVLRLVLGALSPLETVWLFMCAACAKAIRCKISSTLPDP